MALGSPVVLASVVVTMSLMGSSSIAACKDCTSAVSLDEGSTSAVSYGGTTFLVADAEKFVADPEEYIPMSIKATQFWSNSDYWMGTNKATHCTCA